MSTEDFTPQQQLFLSFYLDPKSETWSNAYQSALRAGYTEEYASNITGQMPNWLSDAIRETSLVTTAMNNLAATLAGENDALRWDATKFTLKGLKADKFSEKSKVEHSGSVEVLPITGMQVIKDIGDSIPN